MIPKNTIAALLIAALPLLPLAASAGGEHGAAVYHAFELETDAGGSDDGAGVASWEFSGWVGTDENKVWFEAEGERENGATEQAELRVMYSRTISTFWDVQVGIRHDTQPDTLSYGVLSFRGLAPYFFETEAYLFVSEDEDVSIRIKQENEFLLTQKLVIEPYAEADLFAQDVPELGVGAGLAEAEIGIHASYGFTRAFAPYLDIRYERKFGETASIAKRHGEDDDAIIGALGVKLLF